MTKQLRSMPYMGKTIMGKELRSMPYMARDIDWVSCGLEPH